MSYDISIDCAPCPHCGSEDDPLGTWWNYTSNMAPAWRHAGADLAEFHGMPAYLLAVALKDALWDMELREKWYAAMFNAKNGWGTMDTLIPALRQLHDACMKRPDGTVRVSR